MIKLFLRFFIGMIMLVVLASVMQSLILFQKSEENTNAWIKNTYGGVRFAAGQISSLDAEEREAAILIAEQSFGYDIKIVSTSSITYNWYPTYLSLDEPRYVTFTEVAVLIDGGSNALIFGPVEVFEMPGRTIYVLATMAYFLLSVMVIGFLIRPIAIQFQAIRRAAGAITSGDFGARITGPAARSGDSAVTAFNLMAARTENLLKAKVELLQMVSHEIKTPLSRIHFAVELFESASTPQERGERVTAIVESADDLERLVNDLLKYVRSGESRVEKKPVAMAELLVDIDRTIINPDKSITVNLEGEAVVQCDRVLLNSAIRNLVGNASRFASKEIQVSSVLEGDILFLHIDDDGPGVPEVYRESIFEPFSRLDNSEGGHKNGVGLGLAIVQRAVQNCGGAVMVSESPLGGARFTIRLPLWGE
ncbi:ATP-binding protein [bacterium]|nr:ATP-binding protein [bacterium]